MNTLQIDIDGDRTNFEPGERIEGTASWTIDQDPRSAELRLFWYTKGAGTKDFQVIQAEQFANPARTGRNKFAFILPAAPYSFSGKLISLIWSIELIIQPHSLETRVEFVVAPEGREIELTTYVESKS